MERIDGDADHEVLQLQGFQLVVHRLRGEPDPSKDAEGKVIVREDSYVEHPKGTRRQVGGREPFAPLPRLAGLPLFGPGVERERWAALAKTLLLLRVSAATPGS
ncbi:MAG: hypothetical protein IPP90_02200 [Gemmatimonadaceae bacterium]|nr:hypothetical protein [Gemmatimonadaceae bacterium]